MKMGKKFAWAPSCYSQLTLPCYQRYTPQGSTPELPSILGRRVRDTQDWSPREKARLGTFAKEKCEIYGVPLKQRDDIIEMSQVRTIPPTMCYTKLKCSA
jgi:hypothetical protein